MFEPELILKNINKNLWTCAAMRNIFFAFQNLMSLKQTESRTEPEPEPRTGKNRIFSVNPNRT